MTRLAMLFLMLVALLAFWTDAVSVAHAATPADTSVRVLTLAQAVALAQDKAPAVIHALGQSRTSAASVRSAYGAFLPSVNVSAGASRVTPAANGDPWNESAGLNASVDLFTGGARLFELQQAHAQASAAAVDVVEQRALAALAVKQQFFNVLAAKESEDAAAAQLAQANEQLNMSIVHLKAHTVTRSDSLRSEILVRNAGLARTNAQTAVLQAEATLARLVASEQRVTAAASDSLDTGTLAVSDDALRALALDGPLVHQAIAQESAAKAAVRIGWTGYLPTVTASYSRNGAGTSNTLALPGQDMATSSVVRLAVSVPLFDQFRTAGVVTAAHAALDDAEASLRDTRLAALESLTQSLGSYRATTDQVAAQIATVAAAQEDLREREEQYKVGTSTLLDVLTSQATLVQARHDLIQARYDRRIAKAQLEALTGRSL